MRSLLLLLGLATLAGLSHAGTPFGWAGMIAARADANEVRMQKLNQRLDGIGDTISHLPKPVATGDLAARVRALTGDGCSAKQYQCGGDAPQCISNLLVCDGAAECRNGEDEKHCDNPVFPGTAWSGVIHWSSCAAQRESNIRIMINSASRSDFFQSMVRLDATVIMKTPDGYETANTEGVYQFGSRKFALKPVGTNNVGVVCVFDGVDDHHCTGEIVHPSMDKCADVVLVRK